MDRALSRLSLRNTSANLTSPAGHSTNQDEGAWRERLKLERKTVPKHFEFSPTSSAFGQVSLSPMVSTMPVRAAPQPHRHDISSPAGVSTSRLNDYELSPYSIEYVARLKAPVNWQRERLYTAPVMASGFFQGKPRQRIAGSGRPLERPLAADAHWQRNVPRAVSVPRLR